MILTCPRQRPSEQTPWILGGVIQPNGLTFARDSHASAINVAGVLTDFGNDVPRTTYSASNVGTLLGLLLEGSATNILLNSGSPATQTIDGLTNQKYTLWVVGSGSCEASGATDGSYGTATAGSPLTFTPSATQNVTFTVTGTLTRFQCEAGSFPTSYIATTSASVTRAADLASGPISGLPGTVLVEFVTAPGASGNQTVFEIHNGGANNRVQLNRDTNDVLSLFAEVAGVTTLQSTAGTLGNSVRHRAACRFDAGIAISLDGADVVGKACSLPDVITLVAGNNVAASNPFFGCIANLITVSRAYTDAELVAWAA